MAHRRLSVRDATLAAGLAAASALIMALFLASLSSPANFKDRVAALQGQSRQIRELIRPLPAGSVYPKDALCLRDSGAAAKTLRDSITTLATQANLSLDLIDVRPEPPADANSPLTPVRLRFTATGSYEGVITLLAALSRQRPDVFADGVDMTSKVSSVTASFSGRAFCSA